LPSAIGKQREELKHQPDDVKQLLHLAYLLDCNNETNESLSCYQKAEQLCRNKVAANPQDSLSLIALGETLDALGKEAEAESSFRKATLVSSNEWRCWVSLGNFLPNEYFFSMFPTNFWSQIVPGQPLSQEILDYRPSAEALKKAEAARDEASRCFDQAMVIAPKEPEVFFQRAGYMSSSNWQNCFFLHYRDSEEIDPKKWFLAFFSPETITNLKRAAELKPKDYQYISLAAYFEYFVSVMQANATNFTTDMLPDKTRQSIHSAMTRLENLSEDPNKKIAAGAFENLGFLNMTFENKSEATTDFRRAVALDPTREQAWDLLLLMLLESASPNKDEVLAVCESRLKVKASARNHLILAKTFAGMKKWHEASEQAEIARQQETNDIVPPLMLAAIALKQSAQTNNLSIARTNLARANIIQQKMPENDENRKRTREWGLNMIIFYVLNGQLEWAKYTANEFLKLFPNDETAKEILKMLN